MTEILIGTGLMVALVLALAFAVLGARRILQPALPVTLRLNGRTEIEGMTGQKLLDFLKGAGIPMPSGCAGAGTCGLCRAEVEGAGPPLPTEIATLGRAAVAQGARLSCQVMVRGPLAVRVPDAILSAESWDCEVLSNESLAPLIKELVVALPEGADFHFVAGEYAQVTAPPYRLAFCDIDAGRHAETWARRGLTRLSSASVETVTRAYSIANRPEDAGRVVFDIRLALPPADRPEAPPGVVSSYLFGLKPGDRLSVAGPYGTFRVDDADHEIVLIGGGVGMAPLRAIAHDQLKLKKSTRKISFWYGARSLSDLFYNAEFTALAAEYPNFSWHVALSDPTPEDGWQGETGFIHEVARRAYLAEHPSPEACSYYLCGPPMMMRAVTAMLDDLGVSPETVFFDDFAS